MNIKTTTLQQLEPQEIVAIFKLRVDVFVVEQQCPYPEIDDDDLSCQHLQMKDDDNHLIAYCRIIEDPVGIRIGRVIVHPNYRAKKIGQKLMTAALEHIHTMESSSPKIMLSAQSHLQKFYGSFGFIATSTVYEEDGIPHIDMAIPQ
ncbi:GNAT family N-acetyltransferase [Kurthia sibirica]|uniref:GNAT family N-acetyltransferase n=1 Tax=Kurthia sibirica TaxID=202750 RepID=A0A2U3AIX5_9BACL|nr:GNAT family N-acetyltransferase [Kurthia sibirica]PWI24411.1 GNAT family N-acetyltransferase [Kurthia sibirica]GEK33829.1 GNAT family acetyltransferase [Kurthia sibirica]